MIGVLLCTCQRKADGASWSARVAKSLPHAPLFPHHALCTAEGLRFAAARAKERKLRKLLLAGCPTLQSQAYAMSISRAVGIPVSAVDSVRLAPGASSSEAARAIRRAYAGLELLPAFKIRRVPLRQDVLVMGGGWAGMETARQIAGLGNPTTVIDRKALQGGNAIPGLEILAGTTLVSLTGSTGCFSARLSQSRKGDGHIGERTFGAVVISEGMGSEDADAQARSEAPIGANRIGADPSSANAIAAAFAPGRVIPLGELESHLETLSRRDRPRQVAIVLDYRIDEDIASGEAAMRAAIAVRERLHVQVMVVLRDVRVAGYGLEALYDKARAAGVTFLKHGGSPQISVSAQGVTISCRDTVLGEDVQISCDLVAVSVEGIRVPAEAALAAAAGIVQDGYGRLQENNVHLLPTQTNRQGVFVVGACRGDGYAPHVLRDARDAACSVHALLSQKKLDVELSQAVVDGDKCVLCLTCVRLCPFKAMRVDEGEKRADCIPESCRRCGICVGECPARAITLPAYSEGIVMARAGASG